MPLCVDNRVLIGICDDTQTVCKWLNNTVGVFCVSAID